MFTFFARGVQHSRCQPNCRRGARDCRGTRRLVCETSFARFVVVSPVLSSAAAPGLSFEDTGCREHLRDVVVQTCPAAADDPHVTQALTSLRRKAPVDYLRSDAVGAGGGTAPLASA